MASVGPGSQLVDRSVGQSVNPPVCGSTTLVVTKISQRLLNGVPRNLVKTFMVPQRKKFSNLGDY